MTTAIITATYSNDFERCAFLCESMEARLKGDWMHYLLVADVDREQFLALEGDHRKVVTESEIFPFWCRSFPDPISTRHARVWLTPFSRPLRGWHAQQLRRLAIARYIDEDIMLTLDSDVVVLRNFDVDDLGDVDAIRFYRNEDAFTEQMQEHLLWSKNAGTLLGITDPTVSKTDYITTFIAWRRETVCDMLDHIEKQNKCHWMRAIVKQSQMSECMIYGRYVDEVLMGRNHLPTQHSLCHVLWDESVAEPTKDGLRSFIKKMTNEQVAVGIQSFVGISMDDVRDVVEETHP